jgi:CRP-like cAMP-binding protein
MSPPKASTANPFISHLGNVDLFSELGTEQIERVAQAARQRRLERDAYLYYQGDPADHLFVLLAGRLKRTQVTPEGHQILLRYIGPGEAFAIPAILGGIEYPTSAQAVEDSLLLSWDRQSMRDLMRQAPALALRALDVVASHVREFQDRIRELSTERVERRIARALLRLARQSGRKVEEGVLIDLPLSRQDLAEMTGTTLFTVSRTLSQWESQGLVVTGRERVTIRFPHGLVAIAEDLPVEAGGPDTSD